MSYHFKTFFLGHLLDLWILSKGTRTAAQPKKKTPDKGTSEDLVLKPDV